MSCALTGRRAAKFQQGTGETKVAYEYACPAGHTAWLTDGRRAWGHQVWDTHDRVFRRLFGDPVSVNPAIQGIVAEARVRAAAAAAWNAEQARLWREGAPERERQAALARERYAAEIEKQRLAKLQRLIEPEEMKLYDEVVDPYQAREQAVAP